MNEVKLFYATYMLFPNEHETDLSGNIYIGKQIN